MRGIERERSQLRQAWKKKKKKEKIGVERKKNVIWLDEIVKY